MSEQEKRERYSHILKYTSLFGSVQVLSILVGVVRTKMVALLLGPGGMGLVALFNSTIKFVSDSTSFGISMSGVRNISDAYENNDQEQLNDAILLIRTWAFLTALIGMLICMLLSPLLDAWTFSWGDHTLHFLLLSPVVAMLAITGGEMAVLKGTRALRRLAVLSLYNVIASLLISIPLFYIWGEAAIVPSLVLVGLAQLILVVVYSFRLYPLRLSFTGRVLRQGVDMVRLGIAFVLAGLLGSGADLLIRSYLNNAGSLNIVGMFNAGYMLTVVYGGLVFSAMETDYFPRLSAVGGVGRELNAMVNQQIEVALLLISPMLVIFIVGMPLWLPLLYSSRFMPVLGMAQLAVLAMYMRAIALPAEYIPLSRGDSVTYMMLEGVYDVLIVAFVVLGYHHWGLLGTGVAIFAASVLNVCIVLLCMYLKYGYRVSSEIVKYGMIQIPIGVLSYIMTHLTNGVMYWVTGLLLVVISTVVSIEILHSKVHLMDSLKQKFLRK
ncbi:MAG: hypothetical protein IJS97_05400 [Prevotella sp.]|nr:hypothetical protein [Prevotella sp.]